MTRAAAKMRTYRSRRAAGKIVLRIEVDETDLPETLIESGRLAASDSEDRRAMERAVEDLIEDLISELTRPCYR